MIAADLGQTNDFTAFAIIERAEYLGAWNPVAFTHEIEAVCSLRFLHRMPLGTPYPRIVERIAELVASKGLQSGTRNLVVDATGVGRPVVDLLQAAELGCKIWPVNITSGASEGSGADGYRVPKRDLIMGLLLMIQNRELKIAQGMAEGQALLKEMANMRVSVTSGGREKFGARSGEHDDLVLAVALAVWGMKKVTARGTVGMRAEPLGVY